MRGSGARAGSPTPYRRLVGAIAALVVVAACQDAPAPTPWPSPPGRPLAAASPGTARNRALGIGEARNPEPFTLDQRLLDAVRRADRPAIERALEHGARIDAKDDLARSTVLLAVMDAHDLALARWLHERGVALDEADVGGRTALSFAAQNGRLDMVRYLVEHGAAVDHSDVQKRTPLFHAAFGNHTGVVAFLLDHGAGVDVRDQFGDTPLMIACAKGHVATASLLLARGADPTIRDQEGRTARMRSAPGTAPCLALPE